LLGNGSVNTPIARQWLSISNMVNLTDTNTTIKDSVFYTAHSGLYKKDKLKEQEIGVRRLL
jgi:hypothetical protein